MLTREKKNKKRNFLAFKKERKLTTRLVNAFANTAAGLY